MAFNKNALIRYRTIDKCLQNTSRKWALNDLIEACSNALYEYEGKETNVSKRTIQMDIEMMRGDKLGYYAPIEVFQKKYYQYKNPDYTISDIPLTGIDLEILADSVSVLKQFKDLSLFKELNGVIQKLEDKIYNESANRASIIHLDKNEDLKGLEHLDVLYQAILKKIVLKITYQSFTAKEPATFAFHGYILKEFNNRWFIVGKRLNLPKVRTLALDRIIKVDFDLSLDYQHDDFDADSYYEDTYGVTVLTDKQLIEVVLKVDKENASYILTKPLHKSQKLIENCEDGSAVISVRVHHNFELERLIAGFAESMQVLAPESLKNRIKYKFEKALENYRNNDQ